MICGLLLGALPQQGASADVAKDALSFEAGGLRLSLDEKGKVVELADVARGINYRHAKRESFLLGIQEYGGSNVIKQAVLKPVSLRVISRDSKQAALALGYEGGAAVTVKMRVCPKYLRMEVTDATSQAGVAAVHWGPYATSMEGPIAEYLGLNRSDDFTIGLLGLNPNTEGVIWGAGHAFAAEFIPSEVGGSQVYVSSKDRSRPVGIDRQDRKPMPVQPVPGLTGVGSAVALFGCGPAGELDWIEAIELGEGLPHPLMDGKWAKRSPRAADSSIWGDYTEANIDQWIDLCKQTGIKSLCQRYMFGNWGHFDPHPKFKEGMAGIRACSDKAAAAGIRTTCYTLSNFLMGDPLPEPFISPVPDKRLASYLPVTPLITVLDEASTRIVLADSDAGLLRVFPSAPVLKEPGMVRIDDELIAYKSVTREAGQLILGACVRGFMRTRTATHLTGATAARMYYYPQYRSIYPGTEDLNREVAVNIADAAKKGALHHVILDGLEETYLAGHDVYSENMFFREVYERLQNTTFTSSTMQQHTWHMLTHISWGEGEKELGFRGAGGLEQRLMRLDQLKRNLMPRKIGQYYPDAKTTREDIEWLMGLAAGYDAGVDLEMGLLKNKDILSLISGWEKARQNGLFSEKQKMLLRQTDCIFTLAPKPRFVRRWRSEDFIQVPSSEAPVKALTAGTGKVALCGIDFGWTHDPGIHKRVCITDDLVHSGGATASDFEIDVPKAMNPIQLLCVLRVPPNAPGAVRNVRLMIRFGEKMERRYQLYFPTTLEPGQYLSIPHQFKMAYVYDANHQLLREVHMRTIPDIRDSANSKTKTIGVGVACEPLDPSLRSELRVNMRLQEPYFKQKESLESYAKSNLALHAAVETSGKIEQPTKTEFAVDGKVDICGQCRFSGGTGGNWIRLDLGSSKEIESVLPIFDWGGERRYNYVVEVSEDGLNWKQVADALATKEPSTPEGIFHRFARVKARYVRLNKITNPSDIGTHLVEIFVLPKTGPEPK
jgi:hypothetical protein